MVAQKIHGVVAAAVAKVAEGSAEVAFTVERPKQAGHGDYATNAALIVAKREGKNPREVAAGLREQLAGHELFESVEVAGPGFLNFTVAAAAWQGTLRSILELGTEYGSQPASGQTIEVEFISANPTGPLTLGNGRGGFGGDVLARVLKRAGHTVKREYYLNDAGNQIVQLGKSVKGVEPTYTGPYIAELAKEINLEQSVPEVGRAAAARLLTQIEATVARMNISFDTWFSEYEELHQSGAIAAVLGVLERASATFEQDGALWLRTTEHGDDKDRVLRKADGELTYLAADAAHYYEKLIRQKLGHAILIVGADHHGYVGRMNAVVEMLRAAEPFDGKSTILVTQLVRLVQDGKEVKMSKRAGTYVALDDLLDEIPVDVARFFFVMKSFDTHMDFDLDLAKEQSQKNPVYYVKYAHARIASILRKAGSASAGGTGQAAVLARLTEPAELALIRELSEFPDLITRTAADYQVHRLPHYALGLADVFHKFYEQCTVISDDAELTAARLELLRGTQIVLQNIGETLGIEMPEEM